MGEHIFFEEELFMLKEKKFFLGMAVLLGASLFILGCETEVEVPGASNLIHIDTTAANLAALEPLLVNDGEELVIGVTGTVTMNGALAIPAEKTVYILKGGNVDVVTYALTVDGVVYVGNGGLLDISDIGSVQMPEATGHVYVQNGGDLYVKTALSVSDGDGHSLLKSGQVGFTDGATLTVSELADADALETFFETHMPNQGEMVTTLASGVLSDVKPSDITGISGISSTKRLDLSGVTLGDAEDQATVEIPAGLTLTTSDTLAGVITKLTVRGTLTAASATLVSTTALEVYGTFTSAGVVVAASVTGTGYLTVGAVSGALAESIIEGGFVYASVGTAAAITATEGLVIPQNTTRVLTGAAPAPAGNVTVGAGGTLIVAAGKNLTIADGNSITLTGHATTPATLVLDHGAASSSGGIDTGGKLTLTGGGTDLGTTGDIHPTGVLTAANLTATGANGAFVLPAEVSVYSATINSISATGQGFTSIIAGFPASGASTGTVTFKAGASGTAVLSKTATLAASS
jgi:hypothetical protein